MKKIFLALLAVLAFSFSLKAQQYVSTTPSNRNVVIEEFTGRNCGYCPEGHVIANGICHNNPGRAWAINIHDGGYAPTNYPNFNTTDGHTIASGFSISGYPSGTVNRCGGNQSYNRGQWQSLAGNQFSQVAEMNVAGRVVVNPATRIAAITVEVYYTSDSPTSENYLTVAMLQDSIFGSQSGGSSNPEQWINGSYCHMHILRDVVNGPAWGDEIITTTAGTLVTRQYTYEIPESIGNPNGVDVDLDNLIFLAWVSKDHYYILNANKLELVQGSDEPICPFVREFSQEASATCTHSKILNASIINGGTSNITTMAMEVEVEGETFTTTWEGNMAQYEQTYIDIPVEVPFGTHSATIRITNVNGQPYETSATTSVKCMEWTDVEIEGAETEFELQLMQDKFGNQTTWEALSSNGTILASGGPYAMLMGTTGTQLHVEHFTVPANECVKFALYDNVGNGICCSYGQGYFILYDEDRNVIFGDENDGEFGSEVSFLISVKSDVEASVGETEVEVVNDVDANFYSKLDYVGYPDEVGFECRKVTSPDVIKVVGTINEFKEILGSVNGLDASSIYMVKAYAKIEGLTFYGPETTFNTGATGINEFENSVKIYPNPASDVLNVAGENIANVEVYNAMGQLVLSQEVADGQAQISTAGMNSGIYFIRIYSQNGEMQSRMFSVAK